MKKIRISKWDKISTNCKWVEACECGEHDLCYHPDGNLDLCQKDLCPEMKNNG